MTLLAALATPAGERVLSVALATWLPRQRWYAGKARDLDWVHVWDLALVGDVLFVLAQAHYADGGSEPYHLPLAVTDDEPGGITVVAHLQQAALVDAADHEGALRTLARLALTPGDHPTVRGATLSGRPVPVADAADADRIEGPVHRLPGEQSNSSAVVGDGLLLKLFRRPEPGPNPDVELPRALTERGVAVVPAQLGALDLDGNPPRTLAVVSRYLRGAQDGWTLAGEELEHLAADRPAPPGGLLEHCESLGQAVAEAHAGLADAFGRRPADTGDLAAWADGMRRQAARVLDLAERRAPTEAAPAIEQRDAIMAAFAALPAAADAGPLIRVHGDLHLGQVLRDDQGRWRLIDFEGEPERPLAERRRPHSPLKDVAGMLRSFDYAAAQVAAHGQVENWRGAARRRFLAGYRRDAGAAGLLPPGEAEARLLALFELDKAVYELGYELANRPDWVVVPAAGILLALDRVDRRGTT